MCATTSRTYSVVHETCVVQERLEKAAGPPASDSDRRIVPIRRHVRGYEHPLRQRLVLQVLVEQRQVLHDAQPVGAFRVGAVDDGRVVLPHVVVGPGDLVDPFLALEPGVRHVLLVLAPRDALVLQKVDDRGDVGVNGADGVVVHAEVVTSVRSNIVGLRGVSHAKVVAQRDALGGQPCQVGC